MRRPPELLREPRPEAASRGWFVCLEGIDGAGKTTAVAGAADVLRAWGLPVVSVDKSDAGFGSAYVRRHLGGLREVIWGHPPDDPHLELGDLHWVHLQAAWYAALAECRVRPALGRGQVVLADTWTHKFQAKLALRPRVDLDHVRSVFSPLPCPDVVIYLRVDPAVAAARKGAIAASEAGNHEGPADLSVGAFAAYQRRLAGMLDAFARDQGWVPLEVTGLCVAEVAEAIAQTVCQRLRLSNRVAARPVVSEGMR